MAFAAVVEVAVEPARCRARRASAQSRRSPPPTFPSSSPLLPPQQVSPPVAPAGVAADAAASLRKSIQGSTGDVAATAMEAAAVMMLAVAVGAISGCTPTGLGSMLSRE